MLGMFESAIAANVPCVWEDGTPNLVCDDGSVGGTPPAWGGPRRINTRLPAHTHEHTHGGFKQFTQSFR